MITLRHHLLTIVAVFLALVNPAGQKGAVNKISWSTVLLICGMLTFVGVLQEAGTIDFASDSVASLGSPLIAALLICYIGAIVSAFASSTAILAALIPLAIPFLNSGDVSAIGVVCALAVASTIVDLTGKRPRIIREGAVSAEAIAEVLGDDAERLRTGGE